MESDTKNICIQLLERYICFYEGKDMHGIKQWGLYKYDKIKSLVDAGKLKSTSLNKEKHSWYYPSTELINKIIYPAYIKYKKENTIGKYKTTDYSRYFE